MSVFSKLYPLLSVFRPSGREHLAKAMTTFNAAWVDKILAAHPDLATKAEGVVGMTPLHVAAFHGTPAIAEVLLAHGADVNARLKDGSTPLSLALKNSNRRVVRVLRRHGASE